MGVRYEHGIPVVIVATNHPLYAEVNREWAIYAKRKGRNPRKHVGQVEGSRFFECDGIMLGWSVEEAHAFLKSENEKAARNA